jgi:hypothetical protein
MQKRKESRDEKRRVLVKYNIYLFIRPVGHFIVCVFLYFFPSDTFSLPFVYF